MLRISTESSEAAYIVQPVVSVDLYIVIVIPNLFIDDFNNDMIDDFNNIMCYV